MIGDVIWFVFGCWVAGVVLGACKLRKIAFYLCCGGIPFHELSHLAACLALGVRVRSATLLHVDGGTAEGSVTPRDEIRNPFTALVVALAPGIGAVFWAMLFSWGIAAAREAGLDEPWQWLLLYLAVATGTAAAPSGGDLRYAWRAIARRPGQFLAGLAGSLVAGWICVACTFPLVEWWHLLVLVIAVAGPGVALSKVYGWRRGV
ncbi:MAG: hypothetical protein Q6373_007065 [Candidatus Sigynarchaeota archaeon]